MDSDDDLRRHCLDDVARLLMCHMVFILLKRCVFTLSSLSVLVVPSIWLVTWRCHVVVVVEVVERLQEVGWWWGRSVNDGSQEGKGLFVYDTLVSFQLTPLTWLSIKTQWSLT